MAHRSTTPTPPAPRACPARARAWRLSWLHHRRRQHRPWSSYRPLSRHRRPSSYRRHSLAEACTTGRVHARPVVRAALLG